MSSLLRHFWVPISLTIIVWLLVGVTLGPALFAMVVILTLLEMTLSADNAIVNSRVLVTMSPLWQTLFMTIGIFIAVFVIRFAIPIFSVALATPLNTGQTLHLALHDPTEYGEKLHEAAPLINAFGGIFLSMVAIFFFVDNARRNLWLRPLENGLKRLTAIPFVRPLLTLGIIASIYFTVGQDDRGSVGAAMMAAAGVYLLLHGAVLLMEKVQKNNTAAHKVGWAAFASFMYLEVLDASFSLDGVVGAFALTNNVIVIMAGLGIGAVWVRSMTLHLVRSRTLLKYRYLESGAHWAIVFLASIMILKLFHIELPEIVVGTVGVVCIGLSIVSSNRRPEKI